MAKSVAQYIADLRRKIDSIERDNKPLQIAVHTVVSQQSERIFEKGLNSDNGRIGSYDNSKPFYINPDASPRKSASKPKGIQGLQAKGKTEKSTFKNGKKHKTAYVNSYKDFRNRIGRRIDTVDLKLSGELQLDFLNSDSPKEAKPQMISAHEYRISLKKEINVKKREGLEDKYGNIFNLTKDERELFAKTIIFELQRILTK